MRVFTVVEVADMMGVTRHAVYRWINNSELACVRRGSRWTRVTEEQLQEFVGRYTVPAGKARR